MLSEKEKQEIIAICERALEAGWGSIHIDFSNNGEDMLITYSEKYKKKLDQVSKLSTTCTQKITIVSLDTA